MGPEGESRAEQLAQTVLHEGTLAGDSAPTPAGDSGRGIPLTAAPALVRGSVATPGRPLEADTRADLENRFGRGLDQVRVHDDDTAARSARALRADAFAVGNDILFGRRQFAPRTQPGMRLLAHEVAHVIQQGDAGAYPLIQRQGTPEKQVEIPELEEILPSKVGLLGDIDRVSMLIDIFGVKQLQTLAQAIRALPGAREFTQGNGVPAVVALYDSSKDGRLDVASAKRALADHPDLYKRATLEHATRKVPIEAPRTFWFESTSAQKPAEPGENEMPLTGSEERQVVRTDDTVSEAAVKGGASVFVLFGYPSPDAEKESIKTAKKQILTAIANVLKDLAELPARSSIRARLGASWSRFTKTKPLRVYIASDPRREFETGRVIAETDRVFVNLEDIGHEDRLQAAVRVPLIMLRGGMIPSAGDVPPASAEDLQRILLHESLHAQLIRLSSDADSVWRANSKGLSVQGTPYLQARFVELVRKFLIAQEEAFAYENEASLYPPVSKNKGDYDLYVKNVATFLQRRSLKLNPLSRAIPVHSIIGKAASWTVAYQMPQGAIDLNVTDQEVIGLLLTVYPLG